MNVKSKLLSGIKFNSISTVVNTLLQVCQLLVLARLLSPSDFGLMAMMEIVIGIASIFTDFGVSGAIIHKKDVKENELSSLYWLNYISGAVVFVLILLFRNMIAQFYNEPRLISLLGLLSTIFVIAPLGEQYQVLFQKHLLFNITSKIDIASVLVATITTIVSAFLGLGVYSLIFGEILRTLTKASLSFVIGRKNWVPKFYFNLHEISFYVKFGLFQMGEKISNYFNQRIDQILIGSLAGASTLGYYTMAYNIAVAPFIRINPIITSVAFPALSLIQDDKEKVKNTYFSLIQGLSHFNIPILMVIFILARQFVELFLGSKWIGSITILQLLCIVAIIRSVINPIGSLLLAKGRADLGFYWNVISTIIQAPILYFSIAYYGALGSATSLIAIYSVHLILGYFILIKPLIGSCYKEYFLSLLPPLLSTTTLCLVIFVLSVILEHVSIYNFVFTIILGGISYFLFLYFYYGKEKLLDLFYSLVSKNV